MPKGILYTRTNYGKTALIPTAILLPHKRKDGKHIPFDSIDRFTGKLKEAIDDLFEYCGFSEDESVRNSLLLDTISSSALEMVRDVWRPDQTCPDDPKMRNQPLDDSSLDLS